MPLPPSSLPSLLNLLSRRRFFFLEFKGLADSLRNELILYGISVHLFLPATILTAGFERENLTKPNLTKIIEGPDEGMTPDKVASALIKGTSPSPSLLIWRVMY